MPNSRKSSSNSDRIFYCHHPKHAPCVRSARQRAQHSIGQRETLYMRRAPELWWTPLAAALPYVAFMAPCPSVAFVASMPLAITNGFVQRAFSCGFRNATRHHRLSSNLSRSSRQLSTASRCQRTRILQRAATSSSSQGSRTPASRGPRASSGVERKGDRATSSSTSGKRRAPGSRRPSAYVPSDYRGVVGGSRGKWKARIVSKGGLRQLGTFGCELDAARAYNQAARTLHGSAAKLNFLPEEAEASTMAPGEATIGIAERIVREEAITGAGKKAGVPERQELYSMKYLAEVLEPMAFSGDSSASAQVSMQQEKEKAVPPDSVKDVDAGAESVSNENSDSISTGSGNENTRHEEEKKLTVTSTSVAKGKPSSVAPTATDTTGGTAVAVRILPPAGGAENAVGNATVASLSPTITTSFATTAPEMSSLVTISSDVTSSEASPSWIPFLEAPFAKVMPAEATSSQTSYFETPSLGQPLSEEMTSDLASSQEMSPKHVLPRLCNVQQDPALLQAGAKSVDLAEAETQSQPATATGAEVGRRPTAGAIDDVCPPTPAPPELSFRDLEEIPHSSGESLWGDEFDQLPAGDISEVHERACVPAVLTAYEVGRRQQWASPASMTDVEQERTQGLATFDGDVAHSLAVATDAMAAADEELPLMEKEFSAEQPTERSVAELERSPRWSHERSSAAGHPLVGTNSTYPVLKPLRVEEVAVNGGLGIEREGQADVAAGDSGRDAEPGHTWARGATRAAGWARNNTGEELYEERLKEVVDVRQGLDRYWMEPLMSLTKPEARRVAMQLSNANKLGYVSTRGGPVGKGSLLEFVLTQKEKHPTKVLLTRVGEFYETYGVDAVMMMQHAGLNKMGQEIRAGCPRKNVQQTLDGLTAAGLTVAVYEEINDVNAQRGPSATRTRIKERSLTQVLSPGSPNYLYEGCLRTDDISFRESKPYVGVMRDSSGYLLCQVYADEREVQVSERLTEEAVRVYMEESGVAEPVFDQGTGLSCLPDHTEQLTGFPSAAFPGQVMARVARLLELATSDLKHFRTVVRTPEARPRPVYPSTALQIGLLKNNNVPDLVPCLLPAGYPAVCHRFLRKWLLLPPSYRLADSAHQLCRQLASPTQVGLPPLHAVPVGKAKALLLDRQCNVPFFREIHQCVRGMLDMLGETTQQLQEQQQQPETEAAFDAPYQTLPNEALTAITAELEDPDDILTGGGVLSKGGDIFSSTPARTSAPPSGSYSLLVPHLLDLVAYQSGVEAVEGHLRDRAGAVIRAIEAVVAANNGADEMTTDPEGFVPDTFWRNNEGNFRGSLSLDHEATKTAYRALDKAASELCKAVKEDFPNAAQDLTFDIHNNAVFLTKLPVGAKLRTSSASTEGVSSSSSSTTNSKLPPQRWSGQEEEAEVKEREFLNPHDRNGKLLSKRFTTKRVAGALSEYLSAVQDTEETVRIELQALSDALVQSNDLPVIAQAAHWSVICQALEGHVRRSLASDWCLPLLKPVTDNDMSMQVRDLVPYWLPRGEAVPNSFDFRGLFLLTAPNMSGKSTLMRAVLACSLLGNAGLFTPCTSAVIPRYDGFFLRTASYDIPAEDKSAFALEMDDVRVMLRDSSKRSLALVDELGKGTSARDGAALAGALLEEMDRLAISGIFATHLHELFDLPLKTSTLSYKRMGIDWRDGDNPRWTYTMEEGKCTNSLALETARRYNIPGSIIARAEALSLAFDQLCRGRAPQREAETSDAAVVRDAGGLSDNEGAWWPSNGGGWSDGPGGAKGMEDAAEVILEVTGCLESDMSFVHSGYSTHPALEGRSCLYVLRFSAPRSSSARSAQREDMSLSAGSQARTDGAMGGTSEAGERGEDGARQVGNPASAHAGKAGVGEESGGGGESRVWFYVGESDAIRARLEQHRKRWRVSLASGGPAAERGGSKLDAIVVAVDNKSSARRLETTLIRTMKDRGFYLVSDHDGSRVHFSSP